MNQVIGITLPEVVKTLKRLQKDTGNFKKLFVRDAIDNLDFIFEQNLYLTSLIESVVEGTYLPQKPYLHCSAKSKGIDRPTVSISIEDSIIYRYCLEQVQNDLLAKIRNKNIRGGVRITSIRTESGDFEYEKSFLDWKSHINEVATGLGNHKYAVVTDIASYFENINITFLKDLVRSNVNGKGKILDLLFYFLEQTAIRENYAVNKSTGLLQEEIDCSRILAYFFLHPVDDDMAEFIGGKDFEYFRFVDDMTILLDSEVEGKHALNYLFRSLRSLNLVCGVEKTSIIEAKKLKKEMSLQENKKIDSFTDTYIRRFNGVRKTTPIYAERYYMKISRNQVVSTRKTWVKILKRFYTLFSLYESGILLKDIKQHTILFPVLWTHETLKKYLLVNCNHRDFNASIKDLLDYIYSRENLYQNVETSIIEAILSIEISRFSSTNRRKIARLSKHILFSDESDVRVGLSEYSRALACLLVYKFDKTNLVQLVDYYLNSSESSAILRKYLILVSLTVTDNKKRDQVFDKSKTEQSSSVRRLSRFVGLVSEWKSRRLVSNYLNMDEVTVYWDKDRHFNKTVKFSNVRGEILKDIKNIYLLGIKK